MGMLAGDAVRLGRAVGNMVVDDIVGGADKVRAAPRIDRDGSWRCLQLVEYVRWCGCITIGQGVYSEFDGG